MGKFFKAVVLTVVAGYFGCSGKPQRTPERNFYFDVKVHQNDKFTIGLSAYLNDQIPRKKYTITNRSGLEWPYYAALEPDETIAQDSLMPPHWFLHKMILRDAHTVLHKDDYLVDIHLMPHSDTIPNYLVEISFMDSTGLKVSANSGIHFVDAAELLPGETIYDHLLKSIVRYSFK